MTLMKTCTFRLYGRISLYLHLYAGWSQSWIYSHLSAGKELLVMSPSFPVFPVSLTNSHYEEYRIFGPSLPDNC